MTPAPRPVRLRLSRRKGFRLQEASRALNGLPVVKVDRTTKWGNPFKSPSANPTNAYAVGQFRKALVAGKLAVTVEDVRRELGGKNLACWCAPSYICHADVLLAMANDDV